MLAKLLLAAMLAISLGSAQGRGGGGRGGRGGGDDMGGGMARMAARQTRGEQLRDKLGLNKEQQEEAQKLLIAASGDAGPIRGEMEKARVQIAGALIEGKSDEEVKKSLAAYAAAAAQMTSLEAKVFAGIYATLKPKQQAKAEQSFEILSGIFNVQPGGGAGGGGGMGRGGQGRQRQGR
jgi:hypothetical protein